MDLRRELGKGLVIPAHPLALNSRRQLDERRQRALTRYYCDAGAGGVRWGSLRHHLASAIPERVSWSRCSVWLWTRFATARHAAESAWCASRESAATPARLSARLCWLASWGMTRAC